VCKTEKRRDIWKILADRFPEVPDDLQLFFIDSFDLGYYHDKTREEARWIVNLAKNNNHIDTRFLMPCNSTNWKELKATVLEIAKELDFSKDFKIQKGFKLSLE
jgi:hypothetical protein